MGIKYREGYKYQLCEDYQYHTEFRPLKKIEVNGHIILDTDGLLIIRRGYAWDGCSGPTLDTKSNMRAGLIHDSLYQIGRNRDILEQQGIFLPYDYREKVDNVFKKILEEDGMNAVRRWTFFHAVRSFAGYAADPKHKKPIIEAP